MGKLTSRHYIEITTDKGKSQAFCSCGWSVKNVTRKESYARAHLHFTEMAIGGHDV